MAHDVEMINRSFTVYFCTGKFSYLNIILETVKNRRIKNRSMRAGAILKLKVQNIHLVYLYLHIII